MKQDFRFHTIRTVLAVVLALFSAAVAGAQGRFTVTGKVSDASGKPMVGVTIIEQGTTNGTTTGLDGTYSLVVKDDRSVLQFSSLGYTSQSVTVGSKNEIDVSLSEDAINMSEVVVTGYGRTVTKDKLTAAISKVSSDVLEKGVRSNALTALAGTVTGVRIASTTGQPGAAPSIVIRGGAALDGTGSPLYVIDGVQREDMNDINANDIESIEILKDAAATALYGARANAGVVLVTTKRGRVGRAEISFKANVGLNYLRKTNEFLEADDYLYYLRLASYRSGNIAALSAAGPFGTGNVLSADGNKSAEGVYSPMFLSDENAYLLKQGYKSMIDPITGKTIIYSEFTASDASVRDLALTQDYNISASGGNDRGRYYASLGYYDESGFPVISYYKRLSFVTNGSYKITPWLESTSSLNFSRSDSRQVSDYIGGGEANFFGILDFAPFAIDNRLGPQDRPFTALFIDPGHIGRILRAGSVEQERHLAPLGRRKRLITEKRRVQGRTVERKPLDRGRSHHTDVQVETRRTARQHHFGHRSTGQVAMSREEAERKSLRRTGRQGEPLPLGRTRLAESLEVGHRSIA